MVTVWLGVWKTRTCRCHLWADQIPRGHTNSHNHCRWRGWLWAGCTGSSSQTARGQEAHGHRGHRWLVHRQRQEGREKVDMNVEIPEWILSMIINACSINNNYLPIKPISLQLGYIIYKMSVTLNCVCFWNDKLYTIPRNNINYKTKQCYMSS